MTIEKLIDEAAVNAVLALKDLPNMTVEELEEIAAKVQAVLKEHFHVR
jgi:hypothetical protein